MDSECPGIGTASGSRPGDGAMTSEQLTQVRNATLLQLGALQVLFRSSRWCDHLETATTEQQRLATDLELLVEARFLKLQNRSLAELQHHVAANHTALNEAVEDVVDALDDVRNVGKVLEAAEQLVQVSGRVTAAL
jgi:hypothetical protein